MQKLVGALRPYLIGGGVVALLGGGGWALAASTSGGVIHACASRGSGALRLAGKCHATEQAVSWNQKGRRGAPGKPGAAGPSAIYAAGVASGSLTSGGKVTSLTVPAGSYLIEAKVGLMGTSSSQYGTCFIAPSTAGGPGSWDGGRVLLMGNSPGAEATMSLAGADTFTSSQTIVLDCGSGGSGASYYNARLWAIRTGSLHAKLPLPNEG